MGDLSIAVLVGRLTRDAELKYTTSGQAVCSFSVATSSRVKKADQWVDEPSFWDVDLWGKRAESVNQYLTKGKLVAVDGSMRQDRWEKDGVAHMKVRITANDVQLLGSAGQGGGSSSGGATAASGAAPGAPYGSREQAKPASGRPQTSAPADDFPDDIPF